MASESNKKLSILYTLEILKEYSDENHLLTQSDIISKINQVYGMECERKSIAMNIESLIELGFDIIKVPHKGCFMGERVIEPSEVSFIVDALFSSKSINGKQAKDLAEKISSCRLTILHQKPSVFLYTLQASILFETAWLPFLLLRERENTHFPGTFPFPRRS